jgi:peroxiredoxin
MQALRDAMSQLKERNAVVFGVSADSVESHKAFHAKENLNFPLLADPERKMIAAYGALMPNGMMANRHTFVIGPDGTIAGIDRNVNQQFDRSGGTLASEHGLKLALLLSDWKAKLGQPVPYFALPGVDGKSTGLSAGKKATVVMFLSGRCPTSVRYEERLIALAKDPAYKDVAFLGVSSNVNDSAESMRTHAERRMIPFPIGRDEGNVIADRFTAQRTPAVWVLDGKGVAVYRGAVDDAEDPTRVTKTYLKDALDAVLAGKPVPLAETEEVGCVLRRARREPAKQPR